MSKSTKSNTSSIHELISATRQKEIEFNQSEDQTRNKYGKKSLFSGKTISLIHFDENSSHLNTMDHQNIDSTVASEMKVVANKWIDWVDSECSKNAGNALALADVVVDGKVLLKDQSVISLMNFETQLVKLERIISAMPVLSPDVEWQEDTQKGEGVYTSGERVTISDKHTIEHKKLHDGNEHHAPQFVELKVTTPIGKKIEILQTGAVPPVQKQAMLDRVRSLSLAVKQAKARANQLEVDNMQVGKIMYDFVTEGLK